MLIGHYQVVEIRDKRILVQYCGDMYIVSICIYSHYYEIDPARSCSHPPYKRPISSVIECRRGGRSVGTIAYGQVPSRLWS